MNLVSIGSRQVQGRTVATRLPLLSGLPPSSHPPRGPMFNSLGTNRPSRTLSRGMDRSREQLAQLFAYIPDSNGHLFTNLI